MKFSVKRIVKNVRKIYMLQKMFNDKIIRKYPHNSELFFQEFDKVKVSIIIPFFNQVAITRDCLFSLKENLDSTIPYEIILVDDNSTDAHELDKIKGVNYIRNQENLGFLKNCNNALMISRGEYILQLNNDTIVQPNFLKELFFVFENFKNVGAVGPMILNSDSSLQEAGSVIYNNIIEHISVKIKSFYPAVNYIRKVDYCSGCCLLYKKNKENGQLNTFDEVFMPAYFEDTDLCLDIRYNQNKEIYYTPFSKILHLNGASYKSSKLKEDNKHKLMNKNLKLFSQKWEKQLKSIKAIGRDQRIIELYNNKSIIFHTSYVPEYDKDSGSNRLMEIIFAFQRLGFHTSIVCEKNNQDNKYNLFYQRHGVSVYYLFDILKTAKDFLKQNFDNNTIHWFYGPGAFESNNGIVKEVFPTAKTIYDMVDLHHLRFKRAVELGENIIENQKNYIRYKQVETKDILLTDKIVAISDFEEQFMLEFTSKDKLIVISNIHYPKIDKNILPSFENRKDLLFIGSTHTPNIDAVYFLFNEIMPNVWKYLPDIKVNIVGSVCSLIKDICHPNFILHGYVPSIEDFLVNSRINLAPLRYGAGVKGKIGQSFEYFLPVVTTSIGAEGMHLQHNKTAIIEDDPIAFANAVVNLYQDKVLWTSLQDSSEDTLIPFSKNTLDEKLKNICQID